MNATLKLKYIPLLLVYWLQLAAVTLPSRPDNIEPPNTNSATTPSARIVLHLSDYDADDWTVVQWMDAHGDWHDVAGWQGTALVDGTVVWWVGAEQLGQQQFRWVIFSNATRTTTLDTSATFSLPERSNQAVDVQISAE